MQNVKLQVSPKTKILGNTVNCILATSFDLSLYETLYLDGRSKNPGRDMSY